MSRHGNVQIPPPGFSELNAEEQVEYIQELWDYIAANPAALPIPDWHLQVIEQRLQEHRANPREGRSWDEFREELRAKLRARE